MKYYYCKLGTGLLQEEGGQWAEESSHPPLLSTRDVVLEYCIQSWTSQLERDMGNLDKVLQRVTIMGRHHGHVLYKKQRELVQSLVKKRVRSDMVEAYVYLTRRCKDV